MDQYSDVKSRCDAARDAARSVAGLSADERGALILKIADRIMSQERVILDANECDVELAEGQISPYMLGRLRLDKGRLELMCNRLTALAAAPDPLGSRRGGVRGDNLEVTARRAPLGAVAFIYQCRPQLAALAPAACIKTGNAALLCPDAASSATDRAIVSAVQSVMRNEGYPPESLWYMEPQLHVSAESLCTMAGGIDLAVLRDGLLPEREGLSVPVIRSGGGVSHIYVDQACKVVSAARVTAKTLYSSRREHCLVALVHKDAAEEFFEALRLALQPNLPEVRGCPVTREYLSDAIPASRGDWTAAHDTSANVLTVRVVESVEEAAVHINVYGTAGVDAIMTCDDYRAALFERLVNSRVVCVNTPPTRDVLSDSVSVALGIDGLSTLTRKKILVSGVA